MGTETVSLIKIYFYIPQKKESHASLEGHEDE